MKSESVRSLLAHYLREKQTLPHDEVDSPKASGNLPIAQDYGSQRGWMYNPYNQSAQLQSVQLQSVQQQPPPSVFGAEAMPEIYYERSMDPEEEAIIRGIGRRLSEISDDFDSDHLRAIENQATAIGSKIIQFKHRYMHVAPTCGNIEIPIVRTGNASGTAKVAWRTLDRTARAGIHYTTSRGDISFAEGDKEKTVEIEIIRNQAETDICFIVELIEPEDIDVGSVNPLTVYVTDHSNFYDNEKQVVENIINCGSNASVSDIASCLLDNITMNTFKTALQCICSNAHSVPEEMALGFELLRLSLPKAPLPSLTNVVCNFFSHLPELEDIGQFFDGFN